MDVERTLKRFPPSEFFAKIHLGIGLFSIEDYSDSDRIALQEELIVVIVKILRQQDHLNYYQVNSVESNRLRQQRSCLLQGYHDICLTFLLVLGADLCLPFIDTITKSHFKSVSPSAAHGNDQFIRII